MTNVDDLDRIWRDGLVTAAEEFSGPGDVRTRVAARVRHRRRSRRAMSAGAAALLVGTAGVGVGALHRDDRRAGVATVPLTTAPATAAPVAVVQVDEAPGNALKIAFPGRVLGDPPSVSLPSGLIRFEIHVGGAGHVLRIEGVPGFEVDASVEGETIVKDIDLAPGTYVMYCAIPGHRDAGEQMILVVS